MDKLLAVVLLVIANAASAETIWVTKYALTRGIQKYESAQLFADGQVAVVGDVYFKRGEYWLDEQQAKEHAETLRQRRVSALMRELERLQAVK